MSSKSYRLAGAEEDSDKRGISSRCSSHSRLKIAAVVVGGLCLASAVVVLAVLLSRYYKIATLNQSAALGSPVPSPCMTKSCVAAANRINQGLDPSVQPCDNFYKFACGGWERLSLWPDYSVYGWSVMDQITQGNLLFFKEQLEKPVLSESFEPYQKARNLYASCMNVMQVKNIGLTEASAMVEQLGGISMGEDNSTRDLTQTLIQLTKLNSFPLFQFGVEFHQLQPDYLVIQIRPPDSTLFVSRADSMEVWNLLARYYLPVFHDLYPSKSISIEYFLEIFNIMDDIKSILDSDIVKGYHQPWEKTIVHLEEMNSLVPQVNWTLLFESVFSDPLPSEIIITNRAYFHALNIALNSTWGQRSLQNTLSFLFVVQNLRYFPYKYREDLDHFINRLMFSRPTWEPAPRWYFCVDELQNLMPMVLASWYVDLRFTDRQAVMDDVSEMIERIRHVYIRTLNETSLLDSQTKDYAIRKLMRIEKQVAYPQFLSNHSRIEEEYKHIVANLTQSFFMNRLASVKALPETEILSSKMGLLSDLEREELWLEHAFVVNGIYSANLNRFTIFAGILQGSFYSLGSPKYLNYGSMGFTIGHEFSHGFDDTGRHLNIEGIYSSWWTNQSEANFNEITRCLTAQYSKLSVLSFDSDATYQNDGNTTLDENIADNGAVGVSFKAYLEWQQDKGHEPLIPTPYLHSWQQMFFVALAQGWCAKYTPAGLNHIVGSMEHSQKEARVNGMLMNSADFSQAFACTLGSGMNPVNKCKLW